MYYFIDFILDVYALHLEGDREHVRLYLTGFVLNKVPSMKGFYFMASWLVVLGNVICYCVIMYRD